MPVYHVFTSPQPDVADPTLVRPSDWNSSHLATMVDIVSLGGNTAGALADITGTLFLAGGNNVTLSQNANSVTISAGAVGGGNFTAGVSTGGNTSGDTGVVTGRLVLVGGNNVTLSQATAAGGLATVTISAFNQTLQTQSRFNLTLDGNTSGALALISSGVMTLAGGNNITLSQAGNAVTISGAAQSVQPGIQSISAGTTRITTGEVVFSNSNGLSFGADGQTITGSYTQSTHSHSDVFNRISAGTQIAGTQQTVIFSNSNGVSFGMSDSSVVTASYSQSTHAHTDAFNIIAAGTETANTTGTVVFSNSNGITFGMSNNSIVTASYTQSTHTHSFLSAGMSTGGNTSGTTGLVAERLVFVGGNNITLSQSVNGQSATLTLSAFNQSVQPGIQSISAGTTRATTGEVVFSNSNGLSFGLNGQTLTASYTVPTVPAQFTGGFSTQGNTAGDTALVTGRLLLVGGANITLSGSSNAGSLTLTVIGGAGAAGNTGSISAGTTRGTLGEVVFSNSNGISFGIDGQTVTASYTVPTVPAQFSGGLSNIGNTSGDTGAVTGRLVFAGGNNITLSGSTNAGSMTITVSAVTQSTHTHSFLSAGMSTGGNTSGTTGLVAERMVFVGGDNITLSQSVNGQSATLTISAAAPGAGGGLTLSRFDNLVAFQGVSSHGTNFSGAGTSANSLYIYPLSPQNMGGFPGAMTISTLLFNVSGSGTSNASTGSFTLFFSFGIYTESNGSTLNLLYSASTSFGTGANASNMSASYHGPRYLTIHSSQWSNSAGGAATPSLVGGSRYYGAWHFRSSAQAKLISALGGRFLQTAQASGTLGVSVATATSMGWAPFIGVLSQTTSQMPATIGNSAINKVTNMGGYVPHVVFENIVSSF